MKTIGNLINKYLVVCDDNGSVICEGLAVRKSLECIFVGKRTFREYELGGLRVYDAPQDVVAKCSDLLSLFEELYNAKEYREFIKYSDYVIDLGGLEPELRTKFTRVDGEPNFWLLYANVLWNIGDYYQAYDMGKRCSVRCKSESDKINYGIYGSPYTSRFSPGKRLVDVLKSLQPFSDLDSDGVASLENVIYEIVANIAHETICKYVYLLDLAVRGIIDANIIKESDELETIIEKFTQAHHEMTFKDGTQNNYYWERMGQNLNKIKRWIRNPLCRELAPILTFVKRNKHGELMELLTVMLDDYKSIPQKISSLWKILKYEMFMPERCDVEDLKPLVQRLLAWIKDSVAGYVENDWMVQVGSRKKDNACTKILDLAKDYMSSDEFIAYAFSLMGKVCNSGRKRDILYYIAQYYYNNQMLDLSLKFYLEASEGDPATRRKESTDKIIKEIVENLPSEKLFQYAGKLLRHNVRYLSLVDVENISHLPLGDVVSALKTRANARDTAQLPELIPYMERIELSDVMQLDSSCIKNYAYIVFVLAKNSLAFPKIDEYINRMLESSDLPEVRKRMLNVKILMACREKNLEQALEAESDLKMSGLDVDKLSDEQITILRQQLDEEMQNVAEEKTVRNLMDSIDRLNANEDRLVIIQKVKSFIVNNEHNETLKQKAVENLVNWLCTPQLLNRPVFLKNGKPVFKSTDKDEKKLDYSCTSLADFYADKIGGLGMASGSIGYRILNKMISLRTEKLEKKYPEQWAKIYTLRGLEMVARSNAGEAESCLKMAIKFFETYKKRFKVSEKSPLREELLLLKDSITKLQELGRTPAEVLRSEYIGKINKTSLPDYVKFVLRDYIFSNPIPNSGYSLADLEKTRTEISELQKQKFKQLSSGNICELARLYFKIAMLYICLDKEQIRSRLGSAMTEVKQSLSKAFFELSGYKSKLPKNSRLFWSLCKLKVDIDVNIDGFLFYIYNECKSREKGRKDDVGKIDSIIGRMLKDNQNDNWLRFVTILVDASRNSQILRTRLAHLMPDWESRIVERKNFIMSIHTSHNDYTSKEDLVSRLESVCKIISEERSIDSNDARHLVSVRELIKKYHKYIQSNVGSYVGIDRLVLETESAMKEIISAPSILSVEGLLPVLDMLKNISVTERAKYDQKSETSIKVEFVDVTPVIAGRFNVYVEVRKLGPVLRSGLYVNVIKDKDDNRFYKSLIIGPETNLNGGSSRMVMFSFSLDNISSDISTLTFSFNVKYRTIGKNWKIQTVGKRLRLNYPAVQSVLFNPYLGLSEEENFVMKHADMFKGRKGLLEHFKNLYLQSGLNVGFVYGQRRCGKTAFAAKLRTLIRENAPDTLIANVENFMLKDHNSFALTIYGALRNELQEQIAQKMCDEGVDYNKIEDFYINTPDPKFDDEQPVLALVRAIRVLKAYVEMYEEVFPKRIFLVLDEFTNVLTAVKDNESMKVIFDNWDTLFSIDDVRVQLMLIGHNNAPAILKMDWAIDLKRKRFHDNDNFVRLSVFEDDGITDEARMLITEPLASQSVVIDEGAIKLLKHTSGSNPYFLMSVMEMTVDYLNSLGMRHLRDVDVLRIQTLWLEKFAAGEKFSALMECSEIGNLLPDERLRLCKKVLEMIAFQTFDRGENELVASREIIKIEGYTQEQVNMMINDLIIRGVLKKFGEVYVGINVDIFRIWLKKEYEINNLKK